MLITINENNELVVAEEDDKALRIVKESEGLEMNLTEKQVHEMCYLHNMTFDELREDFTKALVTWERPV